jgi:hypothetical protein
LGEQAIEKPVLRAMVLQPSGTDRMDDSSRPKPKRRWQFSLRTLLIVVVLASLVMGCVVAFMEEARRQRSLAKAMSDAGVTVTDEGDVLVVPSVIRSPTPGCWANIAEVFVETDEGMKYLKEFPNARTVGIHGQVTDAGMVHIKDVPRLEELTLGQSNVSNTGLWHVGQLTGLRKLYLRSDTISDDGLQYIGNLSELDRLGLCGVDVSDAGLVHLKGLTNLTGLWIVDTNISGTGLENLSELPGLDNLRIRAAPITDSGLGGLRALTRLRRLSLSDTRAVTDVGLSHVGKLPQLEWLMLVNVPVTDAGLAHLEQMPCLDNLDIRGTNITDMGIRRLLRASPECEIWAESKRIY